MDALKDRVRGFTECTLTMVCPVLLAVATKKVDSSSGGNAYAWLAAVSLLLCPFAFFPLGLVMARRRIKGPGDRVGQTPRQGQAPAPAQSPGDDLRLWTLRWTKSLVHVSAIGQMVLAYMIYHLITMNSGAPSPMWIWLAFFCLVVIISCIWSVLRTINPESCTWSVARKIKYQQSVEDWEADDREDKWNKKLELSLDLSTAVTSLLFLGLEGLALEGQAKVGKDLNTDLRTPVVVTFSCCVVASAVMLLATVRPIDRQDSDRRSGRVGDTFIFTLWALLAICLTLVVTMILKFLEPDDKIKSIIGIVAGIGPSFSLLMIYVVCKSRGGEGNVNGSQLEPPASLEMTKVTFTAFLAISLPSFRDDDGHLSDYTYAFILTAAMSVNFGLGWRLLSHFEQKAAVWTSKFACLFTHLCLAAAAIELLCMATQALSG